MSTGLRAPSASPAPPAAPAAAPWGRRAAAALVDAVLVAVPVAVVGALLQLLTSRVVPPATSAESVLDQLNGGEPLAYTALRIAGYLVGLAVLALYFAVQYPRTGGQSLGKRLLGIRVGRRDGVPWTFGTTVVRELAVKGLLFGGVALLATFHGRAGLLVVGLVLAVLDGLWPLWDAQGEALHDKVARTRVVRA